MTAKIRTRRRPSLFADPAPTVSLAGMSPALAGATVIAVLAYPEQRFSKQRKEEAHRIATRQALEVLGRVDEADSFGGAKYLNGGSTRLELRLRKRIDVGWLSLQPIVAAEQGTPPLRQWGGRWNRSASVRKAIGELGIKDVATFNYRHWTPSLAVLHLAAALALASKRLIDAKRLDLFDLMTMNSEFLDVFLTDARRFESHVTGPDLRVPDSLLIKIRDWKT